MYACFFQAKFTHFRVPFFHEEVGIEGCGVIWPAKITFPCMKNVLLYSGMLSLTLTMGCQDRPESESTAEFQPAYRMPLKYPETPVESVYDTLHGQVIHDPYRSLEDDRSASTMAWVDAQNAVTRSYLDAIPVRQALRDRFEALYNYEKVGIPRKVGNYYFITRNNGLQNQSVTYRREGLNGPETVFLDPNALSADGTVTASLADASEDDRYVGVVRSVGGSDWQEIRIMETATGKETGDVLNWVKFSGVAWKGNGFYYSRYPEPQGSALSQENTFHSVYYHRLGTPQSADELVFRNDQEPNRYHFVSVTEDKKFLILNTSTGTDGNSLHFKDADKPQSPWLPLVEGFDTHSSVVTHQGGFLYVLTDIDAPRYRLVKAPVASAADRATWTEVIPQNEHLLESVSAAAGALYAQYLRNACSAVICTDLAGGNAKEIALPNAQGTVSGFGGDWEDTELFYAFTSFTVPTSIYRFDPTTAESTVFAAPKVDFNPEDYESSQVWYASKDGTKIPMFLVHKKGLKRDGKAPTYLYAYGGFNISLTPSFNPSLLLLLEQGGIYAMPNLRGGGEFGEDWHRAGMLEKKQNVFDDFIAAGEYLIAQGYTRSERLAIAGGSNGGLLVGAVMTQRPDLARVAFPAVGVLDMVRYHRFTIGWGWIPEYGCADSSATSLGYLMAYSPYHNLKEGVRYPATMVTTADHDDRVVPAHSFKFAARLQACHNGPEPVLIRIDKDAGHGAGKPTGKILDEQADRWAFMLHEMGLGGTMREPAAPAP